MPDSMTDFGFTIDNVSGSDTDLPITFNLKDTDDPYESPGLDAPNTYSVGETTVPSGWTLFAANCVSDQANADQDPRDGPVALHKGETLTCSFTNKLEKTTPTVSTEIHAGDDHVTSVTSVPLGTTVHDKATVTGSTYTPSGNVTFYFYDNNTCSGDPAATSGLFPLTDGAVDATTFTQGPLAAGYYAFRAHYWGDNYYFEADSECEPLTVEKAQLTISTNIHDASHAVVTSVPLGSIVHDTASVLGGVSGFDLPAVSFEFFTNDTCNGTGTAVANDGMEDGLYKSAASSALAAGNYSYHATVGSNSNYKDATSACEPLTVNRANTTIATEIHLADESVVSGPIPLGSSVHDQATVTDTGAGTPTGNVTFYWYTNNTCDGTGTAAGTVTLDSSGVAHPSDSKGPLHAGYYAFKAHYSGDLNYNESDSGCEPLTVDKGTVTLATTIYNAADDTVIPLDSHVPLGTSAYDEVTVTGETVFFDIDDVTYTFDGAAAGSGEQSDTQGPLHAGSYEFQASFAGNDDYFPAESNPEPFTVDKGTVTLATTIYNAANDTVIPLDSHVPLGTSAYDEVTVTGETVFFDIDDVTYTFDGAAAGSGEQSDTQGPLHAGSYEFQASFAGNDDYFPAESNPEPFTVDKADTNTVTEIHDSDHNPVTMVPEGSTVHDQATVSGEVDGFALTGDVTFTWYTNGTCTGEGTPAGSVELDEFGVAHPSVSQGPLAAGSYSFRAHYKGNENYNGSTSLCEPLTVLPKSKVTDTSFCPLQNDQFRLIFTPDMQNLPYYKLTSSNPGQFYYNVFYFGTPNEDVTVTLNIQIPYPFVTQGAVPIQVHGGVAYNTSGCYVPSPMLSGYDITTEDDSILSPSGNPIIGFEDYSSKPDIGELTTVTVYKGVVPDSGLLYVTIHLDYGLEGRDPDGDGITNNYDKSGNGDAVDPTDPALVLIPNAWDYMFSVSGAMSDSQAVQNFNEFKKFWGFGGIVQNTSGQGQSGVYIVIKDPNGDVISSLSQTTGVVLDETGFHTDEDGFYTLAWKHKGKEATYTVQPRDPLPPDSQYELNGVVDDCPDTACVVSVSLGKGVKFAEVNFLTP
jgi:hypothetical protein